MYCERHVSRRIDAARMEFGFPILYRSLPEIDEFEQHLHDRGKYLYDKDTGKPVAVQNLEAWEARWMQNERALCMCDSAYALTRYSYIKDEANIIRRFAFRIPQRLIFDIICDLEDRDAAIEIMFLKARQLGVSTVIELLIGIRIIFSYGINAVIASADRIKSALMANMVFLQYDMMPCWLKPAWTQRVESDQGKLVFGSLSSGMSIQHGNQMSGIARGWTPTIYHLSECASFSDPVNQIEASLFKAVHASPSVFGVLESTGEGDQGWWPDTWRHAKLNWPRNMSRLCPLFLPWFCGTDIYPTRTWIRTRPVPDGWYKRRLPDTREHVAKAEAYVQAHALLAKHLGTGWRMPIEQQWFWEVGHEEHKAKGIEAKWYQEMAGDDIEALQRSAESVFGYEVISRVETEAKPTFDVYGFAGQSIEEAFEAPTEDIDYSRERTTVVHRSLLGESYRWELIPLTHDPIFFASILDNPDALFDYADGKLFVWHPPQPGVDYSLGVDTGGGIGEDATVICVTAVGKGGLPDVQAAEFRSRYVNHIEAFAFIAAIATYYSKHLIERGGPQSQPMIGIEQLASYGDTAQLQLRKLGFTRFPPHIRYDSKKVTKKKAHKVGWFTTSWTRPMLIDGFVHCVQNGWYVLNSPWTIHECKHFEVHYTAGGKEKKEHEDGENDDGIFASSISTFIMHDLESMTERSKKRFMGDLGSKHLPPIDVRPFARTVSLTGNTVVDLSDLTYLRDNRLNRLRG